MQSKFMTSSGFFLSFVFLFLVHSRSTWEEVGQWLLIPIFGILDRMDILKERGDPVFLDISPASSHGLILAESQGAFPWWLCTVQFLPSYSHGGWHSWGPWTDVGPTLHSTKSLLVFTWLQILVLQWSFHWLHISSVVFCVVKSRN